MSEFETPVKKKKAMDTNEKTTISPSPGLNRLGYATGVNVMPPKAGQIRSPWALKMISKRVNPCPESKERLQAEADLLKRISHPNIVGFRAFSKDKILYLGMEACDLSLGGLIEKRIEDEAGPFSSNQILKVAADIGNAVDYLHNTMQILHGDIKSYNILVNGDFVICKLCNFGATLPLGECGVFDEEDAGKVVYCGTAAWSAPEVFHGGEISIRTDIWSLGLTLWEMMALMPPHSLDDTLDATMDSMDMNASAERWENLLSEKYGTRPPIPANIIVAEYSEPLALFELCTETKPSNRLNARNLVTLAIAAPYIAARAAKKTLADNRETGPESGGGKP